MTIGKFKWLSEYLQLNLIVLYHFKKSHFISLRVISCHFMSFHVISYHFMSFHVISCHFMSFQSLSRLFLKSLFTLYLIVLYHFKKSHFMSFHVISCHFMSFHVISCHFMSFHVKTNFSPSFQIAVPLVLLQSPALLATVVPWGPISHFKLMPVHLHMQHGIA